MDPPLAPTVRGLAGPPAAPSDHWYVGSYVSRSGHSEGWKPQKVGGCGWTRCPRNRILSHVAQDTVLCLVSGCQCTLRRFGGFLAPFWAVSRTYRGVRGHQRSLGHEKVKPHVGCGSRLPLFGCFEPLPGLFWAKMAVFGPKLRRFGRAPPDLAPPPRAATGEFLAQNLDSARPPPRLQDCHTGKRSEALGRSNGQNGTETCCCLLACCCC